ncbi:PcfJ domain-containing protein [Virgibacillus halodenitrificans]|uniref:PcfJ domain-containing protein n=1 Tax=Virgibacillus halodenitrificans TaxID=1482 RepID=UPI001FB3857F|nr:PcfJ domain-containing protein [Virgibacillus halodenitrificans]MCJ0932567.1 PcfJ domain-containing protein [Virgibacillus halodenitrificans]
MGFSNTLRHFPKKISQELVDYVRDEVFLESRYLFVYKKKGIQYGYCSHCKKEYITNTYPKSGLAHNQETVCDKCNSVVTVKSAGRGRKNLYAVAYVVWYEKSLVNPEAIVARGMIVSRDYQDFRNTETQYSTVSYYTFEPGYSEQWVYHGWRNEWAKLKNIRSEITGTMLYKSTFVSHDSVAAAVKGTPFQYSTWEYYKELHDREDLVHFFSLAARYSCIEYLTKIGFRKFIEAKIIGLRTYGAINWNGTTLEKVTRLSKSELKQLRREPVIPTPELLFVYQTLRKHGLTISFEQAFSLDDSFIEVAQKLSEPLDFVTKYTLKQLAKSPLSYRVGSSVIRDLRDYWEEAEELGFDLEKEHIKYPNNLQEAHEDTTKRIKVKVNKELNEKINNRLPALNKRSFSYGQLHLRPAASSLELFEEGKQLIHCVGRYATRYAEGDTDIYVLRHNASPDKPFYTLEIQRNVVVQCRGFKNRDMTKEVAAFIEAFKETKLTKRKNKLSA